MTKRDIKMSIIVVLVLIGVLSALSACGKKKEEPQPIERKYTVVGFSQVGAESDWRSANTRSMREAFTRDRGYDLILEDGQQKQSNQITAIRKFIQQGVDYIVLAPVTEKGWDTVLAEAKEAGIPVIIVDRMVDVSDSSLFTAWVGSDFELEAKKVTEWLHCYVEEIGMKDSDIRIVDLQGTIGASAQIGRTEGLEAAVEKYGWTLLGKQTADFTQAKGREVMENMLSQYDGINVVYCENDNSAFGAIEALTAAGLKVGSKINEGEVMVLSFDGVKQEALDKLRDDVITCIAECNPEHGPRVEAIINMMERGGMPEKYQYVPEDMFTSVDLVDEIRIGYSIFKVNVIK